MMTTSQTLLDRIDAEFEQVDRRIKEMQSSTQHNFEERESRLNQFNEICDRLHEVWQPRLDAFAKRFGEKVVVTSNITNSRRSASLDLHSPLAQIEVTFAAFPDQDVRNLVLDYRMHILPILMTFEGHRQIEFPFVHVDAKEVGQWIDDRIVDAVRTYLELHQNAYYLKGHLVRDPVADVEFPKYAAAAAVESKGKTYYFISTKTRDEFAKRNSVPSVDQA